MATLSGGSMTTTATTTTSTTTSSGTLHSTLRQWFEERLVECGSPCRFEWSAVFLQRVESDAQFEQWHDYTTVGQWRRRLPGYSFLLLYRHNTDNDENPAAVYGVVPLVPANDSTPLDAALTMLPALSFAPGTSGYLTLQSLACLQHNNHGSNNTPQADGWTYVDLQQWDAIATRMAMTWTALGQERFRPFAPSPDNASDSLDACCCHALIECYAQLYALIARETSALPFYRTNDTTAAASHHHHQVPFSNDLRTFLQSAKSIVRAHYLVQRRTVTDEATTTATTITLTFCSERERVADAKARLAAFLFVRSVRDEYTHHVLARVERLFLCALVAEAWPRQDMIERLLLECELPCVIMTLPSSVPGSFDNDWWQRGLIDWTSALQRAAQLDALDPELDASEREWQRRRIDERLLTNSAPVQRYTHVVLLAGTSSTTLTVSPIVDTYYERTLRARQRYRSMVYHETPALCRFQCFEQARDAYLLQAHDYVLMFDSRTDEFVLSPRLQQQQQQHCDDANADTMMMSQVMLGYNVPVHPIMAVEVGKGVAADVDVAVATVTRTLALQLATLLCDASSWGCFFPVPSFTLDAQTLGLRIFPLSAPTLYAVGFVNVVLPNVDALAMLMRAWLERFAPGATATTTADQPPKNGKRPLSATAVVEVKPTTTTLRGRVALGHSINNDDADDESLLVTALCAQGGLWPVPASLLPVHAVPSAGVTMRAIHQLDMQCYVAQPLGHNADGDDAVAIMATDPPRQRVSRHYKDREEEEEEGAVGEPLENLVYIDPERKQWRYRPSAMQRAILKRLRTFHMNGLASVKCAPSWLLLVDRAPFDACDAPFVHGRNNSNNGVLPKHVLLAYEDVPRWLGIMHFMWGKRLDGLIAQQARGADAAAFFRSVGSHTLIELFALSVHVFQPLLLRIQTIAEGLIANQRVHSVTGSAGAKTATSAYEQAERQARMSAAYMAMDTMLVDNAATYLPWLLDEPGVLIARGTNYRFRQGGALSVHVGVDDKRGMWKDFESGVGGRGLVRLTRYVRFQDKAPMGKAYELAREWLTTHRDKLSKTFDDKLFLTLYHSIGGASTLTAEQVERVQRYSNALAPGDHVLSYLCHTRGLTGLLTRQLLDWWREHDLVRCEPRARYYTGENEFVETPAMVLWFYDTQWRRGRLQRNYLQIVSANADTDTTNKRCTSPPPPQPRSVVGKLRLPDARRPGELLTSKKFRNVNDEVAHASFLWLQQGSAPDAPLLLAEGFETALSVAVSLPGAHVFVAGGASYLKHFDWRAALPDAHIVVLCRDNDTGAARVNTDNAARQAIEALSANGYRAHEVFPTDEKRFKDFNDCHQAHPGRAGSALVAEMLCSQLPLLRQYVDPTLALASPLPITDSNNDTAINTASPMEP